VVADRAQNGLYTEEQAKRGKVKYSQSCSVCHLDNLNGNGQSPPLAGQPFMPHWEGRSVAELFDRIRTTMPQNNPGSLTEEEYIDIIAFLLESNAFAPGKAELKKSAETIKRGVDNKK
jgi:mono/diheme cytochrome c family protein